MKIVTLTMNPTIDMSSGVEQIVADKKMRCDSPRYEPGGGGINVSRAIARLGGETLSLFPAGGTSGEVLENLMEAENIRHRHISISGETRQNISLLERNSNRQFRFVMPGPELREKEYLACLDQIAEMNPAPEYLVASGSLPPGPPEDFYRQVGRYARDNGIKYFLDTHGEPLINSSEVFLLKVNVREFKEIAGQDFEKESRMIEIAKNIIDTGKCKIMVISLGSGGAILVTGDIQQHIRNPVVPIKSKIGAGDSMLAGIVLGLSRGKSIMQAVTYGVAAGSAAVMTPGTELCRREDVENLYKDMNN